MQQKIDLKEIKPEHLLKESATNKKIYAQTIITPIKRTTNEDLEQKLNQQQNSIDELTELIKRLSRGERIPSSNPQTNSTSEIQTINIRQDNYLDINHNITEKTRIPKGTYFVDKDIQIDARGELHIDEGTTLLFEQNAGIYSEGKIYAKGTENEKITFEAKNTHWRNITLKGNQNEESVFDYCIIKNGTGRQLRSQAFKTGGAISLINTKTSITNTTLINNSAEMGGAIYATNTDLLAYNNHILDNSATKYGSAIYLDETNAHLIHNLIESNEGKSKFLSNPIDTLHIAKTNAIIENNQFLKNKNKHIISRIATIDNSEILIDTNYFENEIKTAFYLKNTNNIITNNIFFRKGTYDAESSTAIHIENGKKTIIDNNNIQNNFSTGIHFEGTNQEELIIANNEIKNIRKKGFLTHTTTLTDGTGMYLQRFKQATIENNDLVNNNVGLKITKQKYEPLIKLTNLFEQNSQDINYL